MNNKLFKITCEKCGVEFWHRNRRKKYCDICREIIRREASKKSMRKVRNPEKPFELDLPLHRLVYLIEKYNAEHRTHYTYGQFVSKLHNGEIKL